MTTTPTPFARYWFTDNPERRSNTGRTITYAETLALRDFMLGLGMFPDEMESRLDYAWQQLRRVVDERTMCGHCGNTDDGLTLGDLLSIMCGGWHRNWKKETE